MSISVSDHTYAHLSIKHTVFLTCIERADTTSIMIIMEIIYHVEKLVFRSTLNEFEVLQEYRAGPSGRSDVTDGIKYTIIHVLKVSHI